MINSPSMINLEKELRREKNNLQSLLHLFKNGLKNLHIFTNPAES